VARFHAHGPAIYHEGKGTRSKKPTVDAAPSPWEGPLAALERSRTIQAIRTATAALALLAAALLFYGLLIEPNRIVVRTVAVPSEELARFFGDARVVHLSDLHVRGIGLREKRLIEALAEIEPDYVFVTGDYIQEKCPPEPALELLARVPAREGIWGVLGNVDYNGRRESCRLCHEGSDGGTLRTDSPLRMLRNEVVTIERGGNELDLIGLDQQDGMNGGPDPADVLRPSRQGIPRMVIAHTPFLVTEAAEQGVDLYLAGDTHGGQVCAPTWFLDKIMPDKIWRYREGLYAVGSLWLVVSHGVGWSILPIRVGEPPEIVLLRFEEGE